MLIREPLGLVYFKYDPFDTKLFPLMPDIPNLDLSKLKLAFRPIKARGFIELIKGKKIERKKKPIFLCLIYF